MLNFWSLFFKLRKREMRSSTVLLTNAYLSETDFHPHDYVCNLRTLVLDWVRRWVRAGFNK